MRAEWLKALFKESTERTLDLSKEILSVSGDHLIALFKKLENKWHLVPEIAILSRAKGHTFNEKYQEHRVFSFQSYDHWFKDLWIKLIEFQKLIAKLRRDNQQAQWLRSKAFKDTLDLVLAALKIHIETRKNILQQMAWRAQ